MTRGVPHAGLVRALRPTLAIAGMMLAMAGCSGTVFWAGAGKVIGAIVPGAVEADVLLIASSWPRSEQARLEREFLDWIARGQQQAPGSIELAWITVDASERLDHMCDQFQPADVLLGGPVTEYARLAGIGRLSPLDGDKAPF
jgi:ABC-type glycerol-3-phosphate transport system substrate-binding protein